MHPHLHLLCSCNSSRGLHQTLTKILQAVLCLLYIAFLPRHSPLRQAQKHRTTACSSLCTHDEPVPNPSGAARSLPRPMGHLDRLHHVLHRCNDSHRYASIITIPRGLKELHICQAQGAEVGIAPFYDASMRLCSFRVLVGAFATKRRGEDSSRRRVRG